MEKKARQFLEDLLTTPSPTGSEIAVQNIVKEYIKDKTVFSNIDNHGNLISTKGNLINGKKIVLMGHCDQLGFIVTHIDEKGYIYFNTVGGWDVAQIIGQKVVVYGKKKSVDGIISRKAIHLLKPDERSKLPKATDLWIDIGSKSKKETNKLIKVGDYATLDLSVKELRNGTITASGIDDKAGVWICAEAFRRLESKKLKHKIYLVSSVQEEIGGGGAATSTFGIDPHIGIAVDVTHTSDCPTISAKEVGDVKLGGGPVIQVGPNMTDFVSKKLIKLTKKKLKIKPQVIASGRMTGTDASKIKVTGRGVATGLIGIPNRYMHSPVEMVNLDDLEKCVQLLVEFCMSEFE